MTKMLIDIDEGALDAARQALATTTKKETVNAALRETVDRIDRATAWAEAQRLAGEAHDLGLLADKET